MAAKVTAFFITLLVNVVIGVVVFFMMLLGMNGFHESDANFGFGTYIVLAVAVTLLMSVLSIVAVHALRKRDFGFVSSALISILAFSVTGGVLKAMCCVIGIAVAEFVRVNY